MASQPPTAAVTDTLQKYFCPRLIDYLAIVGSVLPPAKNEGDQSSVDSSLYQNPKILRLVNFFLRRIHFDTNIQ